MYRLVTTSNGGLVRKHYYETYDDMEYNAVFLQFSPNVTKAIGQKLKLFIDHLSLLFPEKNCIDKEKLDQITNHVTELRKKYNIQIKIL